MVTEAAGVLAAAAQALAPYESEARETLLAAFEAAVYAGPGEMRTVFVDLARFVPPREGERRLSICWLEGFVVRFTAGYERSVAPVPSGDPGAGLRRPRPWHGAQVVQPGMCGRRQPVGRPGTPRALVPVGADWRGRSERSRHSPSHSSFRTGHDLIAGRLDEPTRASTRPARSPPPRETPTPSVRAGTTTRRSGFVAGPTRRAPPPPP
jgi:hypothetical protein